MTSPLFALISSQGIPQVPNRKALIVLGPQNEFLSDSGILPVANRNEVLDRITKFAVSFREFGTVIWTRHLYDEQSGGDSSDDVLTSPETRKRRRAGSKPSSSENKEFLEAGRVPNSGRDDEFFLKPNYPNGPCCVAQSLGAGYHPRIEATVEVKQDLQTTTAKYSAFQSTNLLQTLRPRFITQIYLAGCISNLSIHATALDAAQYGIEVTLVEDCLGYRNFAKHQTAVKRLKSLIGARCLSSSALIMNLQQPTFESDDEKSDSEASERSATPDISAPALRVSAQRFHAALAALDSSPRGGEETDGKGAEFEESDVERALELLTANPDRFPAPRSAQESPLQHPSLRGNPRVESSRRRRPAKPHPMS